MILGNLILARIDPEPQLERVPLAQVEFARLELSRYPGPANRKFSTLSAVVQVVHDYRPAEPGLGQVTRRFCDFGFPLRRPVSPATEIAAEVDGLEGTGAASGFIRQSVRHRLRRLSCSSQNRRGDGFFGPGVL